MPVGAEVLAGGTHFRVWAPRRRRVEVVIEGHPGSPVLRGWRKTAPHQARGTAEAEVTATRSV